MELCYKMMEEYRVVQKKGTVLLSTSLAWPAVAGCNWAETFSQLDSISVTQPCRCDLDPSQKGREAQHKVRNKQNL